MSQPSPSEASSNSPPMRLVETNHKNEHPFRRERNRFIVTFVGAVAFVGGLAGVVHPKSAQLENVIAAVCVVLLQAAVYGFAVWKALGSELLDRSNEELDLLKDHIEADLNHGVTPDWHYLAHSLQACYESVDDKLRSLAAAALALGLGSTIAFLLINVPANLQKLSEELGRGSATGNNTASLNEAAQEVAQGTLFSLAGSLLGASSHLLLVLMVLPRAERRCLEIDRQARAQLRGKLNEILAARPKAAPTEPVPDLTAAELKRQLQTQLRNLRTAEEGLNSFAQSSTEALQRLESAWTERLQEEATLARAAREGSAQREKQLVDNILNLKLSLDRIKVALDELPGQVGSAGSRVGQELARSFAQEMRSGRPVDPL